MSDTTPEPRLCSKCGNTPAGPGGILCPTCKQTIADRPLTDTYGK